MMKALPIITTILAILTIIAVWAGGALFSAMWLSDMTDSYPHIIDWAAGLLWIICFFVIPICVIGYVNDQASH